ncbi:transcription elongation factor [uncultured Christiangramia sp.]|uniref:transcription elongation factor n=1 Tax=uncultured Christiangramia sp. TaxID=503836 RepID=UPI0025DD40E7|nr:transcription elongation factor [uncultured Christiangramia sp.]|tara:strand:+ start:1980 stop:2432 length:453 start_codon:yes stop_codon:yes gene_type:complete
METLKQELLEKCEHFIQQKTAALQYAMQGLKQDLENESKSSAGDKFETGREMINIEWNKISNQLQQYEQMRSVLKQINVQVDSGIAKAGSIIFTENANYFISIPAGEIIVQDTRFYAIGSKAPVAIAMLGKTENDSYTFNQQNVLIKKII